MNRAIAVDTSVLVAIALDEPDRERLLAVLDATEERLLSTFSLLEAELVLGSRRGKEGPAMLEDLRQVLELQIVPLTESQVVIAKQAWWQFGKGRHPASLNIGDCCTYALARSTGRPLLCKGNDFAQTDLTLVEY